MFSYAQPVSKQPSSIYFRKTRCGPWGFEQRYGAVSTHTCGTLLLSLCLLPPCCSSMQLPVTAYA